MSGAEQPLLEGACMQFPSHASGDVAFGPDGFLYASAGDGASFDTEDWGQAGNPCGDPVNEGGSLRSQDIRTSGDPLSISGSIVRINNPANGNAANGSTSNADRIVAYGQRNPWRLTFRPGTSELWSGDVGGSIWEEVNRIDMASFTGAGQPRLALLRGLVHRRPEAARLGRAEQADLREPLRRRGGDPGHREGAVLQLPHPRRRAADAGRELPAGHLVDLRGRVHPLDQHLPGGVPRLAVLQRLRARLHLAAGQARRTVTRTRTRSRPFVEAAETPVGIEVGPGGDLFYVDYGIVDGVPTGGAGDIHRIVYTPSNQAPVAALTANPTSGAAPLDGELQRGGLAPTPDPVTPLTYEWALDGDGVFNDGGGATKTKTYNGAGQRHRAGAGLRRRGGVDTESVVISPGQHRTHHHQRVAAGLARPGAVGQTINFSATATDAQQTLPDAQLHLVASHRSTARRCVTPTRCTTWVGPAHRQSFPAPDHEYPSRPAAPA